MLTQLRVYIDKFLRMARLKPLSLAEKCRLQFGSAVLFSLTLALLIPYFWMGKLTEKIALDAGRAVADSVFERHLQVNKDTEKGLPRLEESGVVRTSQNRAVRWIRLGTDDKVDEADLSDRQIKEIERLREDEQRYDLSWVDKTAEVSKNNYIQIVRAADSCISCHNSQGSAGAFNKNQIIGALVIQTPAREIAKTVLMNRICIIVGWLLAATGAMIAFYSIAQRIILSPIRQLRALVNNITEGNLDARSAIKSNDEYEKLSDAFNNMLDGSGQLAK